MNVCTQKYLPLIFPREEEEEGGGGGVPPQLPTREALMLCTPKAYHNENLQNFLRFLRIRSFFLIGTNPVIFFSFPVKMNEQYILRLLKVSFTRAMTVIPACISCLVI